VTSARAARNSGSAQSVTEISDDEFALFQTLICRESGIHLAPSKKPMLVSRLMRRVNTLKLESFGDYYRHILNDRMNEMVRLLDAISTNETWFFRNPKHFSFVRESLCPLWEADARDAKRPRRVVAWSAASSSGEEPFSLAMALLDGLPGWDIRILATDLSSRVLEKAEAATWSIERSGDIPPRYLKRFMLRGTGAQHGKMKAGPELRNVVTFRRFNLNDEFWSIESEETFDLVFCRNVLMYFEPKRRERVLRRIIRRLPERGYLFLGDAEGLTGFDSMRLASPAVYTARANPDFARIAADHGPDKSDASDKKGAR
jgi:chemotaxis protein methyltransferase CheR